ncbi:twin-arginine translocase subunit TatC [Taibaiella chishuiensis]|uniref:Sec-independent protein translocase protein TatC n=1 Tax=Taibaiella chishuiensis TaxID=1434707 RepID=A0A2P8D475_9BACT|nr:twin-arginine translocase subunit TatC [Taibaiella chishuiensis]PSK92020.1 sec-independent protein translocase protein TatC [Taibaiella chishuiensis]
MSILDKFLEKRSNSNPNAEMGFTDHIEELRWHIVRSLVAIILGALVVYFNIDFVFQKIILGPANNDFISYKGLCSLGKMMNIDALCLGDVNIKFQNNQLSGQFMMSFSVSFMLGFILAFPYVFWEFWKFFKPALKPSELKYAKGIVFWSSTLFFVGVAFAYFLIAPFTINFFANYQLSPQFENIITIDNYYDTMSDLILGMGIVFELPILVYFLSRLGILTPKVMRDQRRIAIVIIMVLAAVITPPDWFSIFLVAIPLAFLYEAAIMVSARILKEKKAKEDQTLDW